MALTEQEINSVVEAVLNGNQEKYVKELTERLTDRLADELFGYSDEVILRQLALQVPKETSEILSKYKSLIRSDVEEEVREALEYAVANDVSDLTRFYGEEKATEASSYFTDGTTNHFKQVASQTARGIADIVERQNLNLSRDAEKLYYEVVNNAINNYNLGIKTEDEIIEEAVEQLSNSIDKVNYASGQKANIDVAIRRHLVTQMSQAGGRMTIECLESFSHELVITSAHYGARPTHAVWQGKPCAIHGPAVIDGVEYPGLEELTDYGTPGGLKGVNCRHSIEIYFPGITELPDTDFAKEQELYGMTSEEYYNATQRQRALERRIRATKAEIARMETSGLTLDDSRLVQKRLTLGKQQATIRNYVANTNGLVRQYDREKAYGVSKQPRALKTNYNIQNIRVRNVAGLDHGKGTVISESAYKELRDYAESRGVALSGFRNAIVDVKAVKQALDAITEVIEVFPELKEKGRKQLTLELTTLGDNTFAQIDNNRKHIVSINAKYYWDKEFLDKEYGSAAKEGWFVRGTTSEAVIYHEMGHKYASVNKISSLRISKRLTNINERIRLLDYINNNLSIYAASEYNCSEVISEVFSAYFSNVDNKFAESFMKDLMSLR